MFAQVIEARATDADAVRRQFDKWATDVRPGAEGFLGSTVGLTDDGKVLALARFESEDAASRRSDRPEQSRWWEETSRYLEDATFHNCAECDTILDGGSDDAGFVQVIQGRATDIEKVRRMGAEMESGLRDARPDVIGGLVAWDGSDFTQFIYFTSEADAREGEKKMSEGGGDGSDGGSGAEGESWDSLMSDLRYADLRNPLMFS